jgi:hypothetical protein
MVSTLRLVSLFIISNRSELGTAIKNIIPSSDETGRPAYPGEKHAILQLPNGKYGMANYMGPGTQVINRLKRGDPPRTKSDKVAMRHDIDYALAKGASNKDEQANQIRQADKRMVASLDRIANERGDNVKNIFQGRRLIQAKMLAEDTGAMKKGSFGGDLENINPDDKVLLMSKKAGLEQEGYGLPAQALKMKLVRQMRKKKQKGGRISMSKSYGTSKGHKLKGGFFQFLAPLLGTVARSVGTSLLGGILGKVFGGDGIISDLSGKASKIMKGKAVKMIGNIISNITHSDLPNHIVEKAGQALELIHQMSDDNKTKKDKILTVGKFLIPHVKNIIASKMNGEGLTPAGGAMMKTNDKKIIEIIRKDLNKIY